VFDRGEGADDRWSLLDRIPEDAAMAILERTTVSADHRLARAVARAWLDTGAVGSVAEQLLRSTMISLRVQAALTETSALDDADLQELTNRAFAGR